MEIHCIFGPTGAGKTSKATNLARKIGAPVIVMDRVQAYPAFAVGSGCPSAHEIEGTERIYLASRDSQSDYPAGEALNDLRRLLKQQKSPLVILEGGSISLWQAFTDDFSNHPDDQLTYEYIPIADQKTYEEKITRRIIDEMLVSVTERTTMIDEAEACWDNPDSVEFMRKICGYDVVCLLCDTYNVRPAELLSMYPSDTLAHLIMQSHKAYAVQQIQAFTTIIIPQLSQIIH